MLSPSGRRWGGAPLLLLRGGRKLIVWAVVLTAAIGLIVPGAAEAVEVSGELEVAGWGRFRIPHGGTWRNRLHLAMEEQAGSAVIRVQGRLEARDGDAVSARLQETTLTFSTGELHWVVGRQVIEWGSAFLIQPTSVVNPLRYADGEPERVPVDAMALRWRGRRWNTTLVWIPTFVAESTTLPDGTPAEPVPKVFDYSQWVLRSEIERPGFQLGWVVSRGWDRRPAKMPPGQPDYRLGTMVGAELGVSVGRDRLWIEGTYGKYDDTMGNAAQWVLGMSRTGEDGLYRALQWHRARSRVWGSQEHLMLVVEKDLSVTTHLSVSAIYDLRNEAYRIAPTVEFPLGDSVSAAVTVAYGHHRRRPLSLPLSDNEVRVKLTTRF